MKDNKITREVAITRFEERIKTAKEGKLERLAKMGESEHAPSSFDYDYIATAQVKINHYTHILLSLQDCKTETTRDIIKHFENKYKDQLIRNTYRGGSTSAMSNALEDITRQFISQSIDYFGGIEPSNYADDGKTESE